MQYSIFPLSKWLHSVWWCPGSSIREGNGTPLQYSCLENPIDGGAWWAAVCGIAESRTRLTAFTLTFYFHALEKEMATHSSVLAWRIPEMGEPGGLPSLWLHRVRHDWSDLAAAAAGSSMLLQFWYYFILFNDWVIVHCIYVQQYNIFFIYSFVNGHWGCFHVLAATMNIGVHVSFWTVFFSGYVARSGIVGSYGSSIFSFQRNFHTVLHRVEPFFLLSKTFAFHFHALEKEMATHSSVLAWRIPGTVEPRGLPSMGSHRVRHDWRDLAAVAARLPSSLFNEIGRLKDWNKERLPFSKIRWQHLLFSQSLFLKIGTLLKK